MQNLKLIHTKDSYLFKKFNDLGVIAGFSSRKYDLGFQDNPPQFLKKARREFLKNLGIKYNDLVCSRQVHKTKVLYVDEKYRGRGATDYKEAVAGVDALITDKKNLPLAVFTADCLSIFLFDTRNKAIGILHSGWRGTKGNIVNKALNLMRKRFNARPSNLLVGFGPAIRGCCYEVTKEFKSYFPASVIKRDGKLYFDIVSENRTHLTGAGVKKSNILDADLCTSCLNREFYSYRKEGARAGRMMSVIMLT